MSAVRMVEAAPIVEFVETRGGLGALGLPTHGRAARAYYRARRSGSVSLGQADLLAVKVMGRHPAIVYGPSWWAA